METGDLRINDLVQIIQHPDDSLVGTILQVDEVKEQSILGWVHIPFKGDAYFRMHDYDIVKVGTAVLGHIDEET